MQHQYQAGEVVGLTAKQTINSNLLISSGAGATLTIKRWGKLEEVKPLILRFDAPLFINNTPFVDGHYVKLRWVVGVSRAF